MRKKTFNKIVYGFTLIELLVSVAVLMLLTVSITTFQRDIFSLNYSLQGSLNAEIDARHIVKIMVAELRKAGPSATGTYTIALASSTGITFYSDVDNDGVQDQVRYFLNGSSLKKGVIKPTGSPLTYNSGNEVLTTLVNSVTASSTVPIFEYYPGSYAGTSTPLSIPVNIPSVRLVKITVIIDKDPNKSPHPLTVTSQVNLRNLKDNL